MGTITFGNSTVGSCPSLVFWELKPASINTTVIEKVAPLGTGYWIKEKGKEAASFTLDLKYLTSSPDSILSSLEAIDQVNLYDLTLPIWGTFANVRLENIGEYNIEFRTEDGDFIVATTLTFRRYPA
jgi:hypothetical protein